MRSKYIYLSSHRRPVLSVLLFLVCLALSALALTPAMADEINQSDLGDSTGGRCTVTLAQPLVAQTAANAKWYLVNGCGVGELVNHMGQDEIRATGPCPIRCWEIKLEGNGNYLTVKLWTMNFVPGGSGMTLYNLYVTGAAAPQQLWAQRTGQSASIRFRIDPSKGEKPELTKIVYDYH